MRALCVCACACSFACQSSYVSLNVFVRLSVLLSVIWLFGFCCLLIFCLFGSLFVCLVVCLSNVRWVCLFARLDLDLWFCFFMLNGLFVSIRVFISISRSACGFPNRTRPNSWIHCCFPNRTRPNAWTVDSKLYVAQCIKTMRFEFVIAPMHLHDPDATYILRRRKFVCCPELKYLGWWI